MNTKVFFLNHIFAYYDLLLPIGSDENTKRLQMWLNNPQCGYKEGEKFQKFWSDNHQGKSSHIHVDVNIDYMYEN